MHCRSTIQIPANSRVRRRLLVRTLSVTPILLAVCVGLPTRTTLLGNTCAVAAAQESSTQERSFVRKVMDLPRDIAQAFVEGVVAFNAPVVHLLSATELYVAIELADESQASKVRDLIRNSSIDHHLNPIKTILEHLTEHRENVLTRRWPDAVITPRNVVISFLRTFPKAHGRVNDIEADDNIAVLVECFPSGIDSSQNLCELFDLPLDSPPSSVQEDSRQEHLDVKTDHRSAVNFVTHIRSRQSGVLSKIEGETAEDLAKRVYRKNPIRARVSITYEVVASSKASPAKPDEAVRVVLLHHDFLYAGDAWEPTTTPKKP